MDIKIIIPEEFLSNGEFVIEGENEAEVTTATAECFVSEGVLTTAEGDTLPLHQGTGVILAKGSTKTRFTVRPIRINF